MPYSLSLPHLLYMGERAIALQCLCDMSAPLIAYLISVESVQEGREGEVSHIYEY
tara:strand:+ start:1095 stop:1259 length:165 start_codon:yes stop_codon:yes gene_type:complete